MAVISVEVEAKEVIENPNNQLVVFKAVSPETDTNFLELTADTKTVFGTFNKYRLYWSLSDGIKNERKIITIWLKSWNPELTRWEYQTSHIRLLTQRAMLLHDPLRPKNCGITNVHMIENFETDPILFWLRAADLMTFIQIKL